MRQRLTIILTMAVILGLLVILNTVAYVKDEKAQDTELTANRSTYHAGPTGSRAIYDLLSESGYKVMRWREIPAKLLGDAGQKVKTFVVIGRTKIAFTEDEADGLLAWVERGGNLVLIDREPEAIFLKQSSEWLVTARHISVPDLDVNPGDPKQMTEKVTALQPVQPTLFTHDIQAVMPSRFASRLSVETGELSHIEEHRADRESSPDVTGSEEVPPASAAPVVHIGDREGALLVDYAHGLGRVVVLSDPYIVANGGIGLKDNLQLAINTLTSTGGLIAFDEYHQGKGVTQNHIASYFAGTPVLPIGAQLVVLLILILWTRSRRFGRPLPLTQVDRRSSLEFVASMSELQERSRSFDLAIENIYSRTRRVLARYAGVDYNSPRAEIATRVGIRSGLEPHKLETLMRQCEEAINGSPINWRQSIDLVRRLREVEGALGLRMRSREVRQAAENI
jgi:hypothetical protein